jgi:hypothetical protein
MNRFKLIRLLEKEFSLSNDEAHKLVNEARDLVNKSKDPDTVKLIFEPSKDSYVVRGVEKTKFANTRLRSRPLFSRRILSPITAEVHTSTSKAERKTVEVVYGRTRKERNTPKSQHGTGGTGAGGKYK